MSNYIDCTLNFLRSRKDNSDSFISLRDVQASIATTQRKTLTLSMFKQILFLCPDLYDHKWQMMPMVSQREPVLTICFKINQSSVSKFFLNQEDISARQTILKGAIVEHTAQIHKQFLQGLEQTEMIDDIFYDPIKIQMWHHKFDPHSNPMITDIPQGSLSAQPQYLVTHRSTSVKDFLKTSNMKQTLIQDALRQVSENKKEEPTRTESEISKLEEMSAKYGISISTLKLVQKKKQAQDQSNNMTQDLIESQSKSSNVMQMHKLLDNLHHQFIMKQKQVLPW